MPVASRTETRLEAHRREFQQAERRGPLLRIEELTQTEIDLISADFLSRVRGLRPDDLGQIYFAYVDTLHSWGVICPHPQQHRRYDGFHRTDVPLPFEESRWYECGLCSACVINR